MQIHCHDGANFQAVDPSTRQTLRFQCAVEVDAPGGSGGFGPWVSVATGAWEARHPSGVIQRVVCRSDAARTAVSVGHTVINRGAGEIAVRGVRTVTGTLEFGIGPVTPAYLHVLNARHDLAPLTSLAAGHPSLSLGRVSYPFFEGLVVCAGPGGPCMVTGPLTQRLVHRWQQLTWDGGHRVELGTEQDLRGLVAKRVPPGATLELDGVFIQFRARFDPNTVFEDYLGALQAANGTRWQENPLRRGHFHAPWNNYLYWEATEADILATARALRRDCPDSVQWMGVDDGYQRAWVQPRLARRADGERDYDLATEMVWFNNCPGISFAFPGGLGEDREKYPQGLQALAGKISALGLRPLLWLGMEISTWHPLHAEHPEWFLPLIHAGGHHALLDVSRPEVRDLIEGVFRTYFGPHAWQAIKLDFWSPMFERPDLAFSQGNSTAAEWRAWFFAMIRRYLPDDGFMNLGCDLAMGAPWVAPWADSYRVSMDMRDGDWENVKNNIRWSMVPALTHGFGQPIGDCDSIALFKGLSPNERTCWADYSHQIGSLVEVGGDLDRWTAEDRDWIRAYLDEPRGGERCWFGDAQAWQRDGLPRVVSRWRPDPAGGPSQLITSLHNWSDTELVLAFGDCTLPVAGHAVAENLRTGERIALEATTTFRLPPRSSCLLRTR